MKSLWQATSQLPSFPALQENLHADVLVVGGGITGILCAHALQAKGVKVVLVEAEQICSGVTANTTAKLTVQHGLIYHRILKRYGQEKAWLYLQANEHALWQLRLLAKDLDCDYTQCSNHIYSQDNRKILEAELSALQQIGAQAYFTEHPHLPFPSAGSVTFPDQANFHPLRFLGQLAKQLTIYENTPVRDIRSRVAYTDRCTIQADHILAATHFPFIDRHGLYFMKMYQHRSYVLALKNAPAPADMYACAESDGYSLRSYQDLLLFGGGSHRTGHSGGGYAELERAAKEYYPDSAIAYRWAAQDCMTLDGIPYIGRYSPHFPGVYTATGFNKWGMTGAMCAAMTLEKMILGGTSPFTEVFSPSRTLLHSQLPKNILSSAANLLRPTAPRCSHLGCALHWNKQEHTWDCPCHGSRFQSDGKVLNAPASKDTKISRAQQRKQN